MVKTITNSDKIQEYLHDYFNLHPHEYTINNDGVVDVYKTHVNLINFKIQQLHVKFGVIHGNFHLECKKLRSLVNIPHTVQGDLTIQYGNLESLEGCTQYVYGSVNIQSCGVSSLTGFPINVGGAIKLDDLNINGSELKHLPRVVKGSLYINYCYSVRDLEHLPTQIQGRLDLRNSLVQSLTGFEGCDDRLIMDYMPTMPLLRGLLAQKGITLFNRGIHTQGWYSINVNNISDIINKYKGKGKQAMLNAALDLKKLGQAIDPEAEVNPLAQNARW